MRLKGLGELDFRLAIEASPAAMIITNVGGVVEFANAQTERMFGYQSDELLGKSIDSLVPAPVRTYHGELRRSFVSHPTRRPMGVGRDLKATRKDGTEFPVEIGLTPIETQVGIFVLATVVDISARRDAQMALVLRASELERANERLKQFAYVASHDLQEPLRKIAAFANLLDEAIGDADKVEVDRAANVIKASAVRARALVDDLLAFSRAINSPPELEKVSLADAVASALSDLSEPIKETGAVIVVNVPKATIMAGRAQLARVLLNVISNAIKYRKVGKAPLINISATRSDATHLRLTIEDKGSGFEESYAREIFEPFKRLHSKADYPGTGIGLAICKTISDHYGWEISAHGQPGVGASFSMVFETIEKEADC